MSVVIVEEKVFGTKEYLSGYQDEEWISILEKCARAKRQIPDWQMYQNQEWRIDKILVGCVVG